MPDFSHRYAGSAFFNFTKPNELDVKTVSKRVKTKSKPLSRWCTSVHCFVVLMRTERRKGKIEHFVLKCFHSVSLEIEKLKM